MKTVPDCDARHVIAIISPRQFSDRPATTIWGSRGGVQGGAQEKVQKACDPMENQRRDCARLTRRDDASYVHMTYNCHTSLLTSTKKLQAHLNNIESDGRTVLISGLYVSFEVHVQKLEHEVQFLIRMYDVKQPTGRHV